MTTSNESEPSVADWRRLYQQAQHFREQAPWTSLTDSQAFAVRDPETGEVAYCSIMGAGGMEYGLVAYLGAPGLRSYALVVNDALDEDEALLVQDCLSLHLGDREMVDGADRSVHAALGLRFRGRGAWPMFRRQRPVYLPKHLSRWEAQFLGTCLEQTGLFVEGLLTDQFAPTLPPGDSILGRRADEQGAWTTVVLPLPPRPPPPQLGVDEVRLQRVRRDCPRVRQAWEVRVQVLTPITGEEEDAPFFARVLLCVDQKSGMVLPGDVLGPRVGLQEALLGTVERAGAMPEALRLTSGYLEAALLPLTEVLGIKVRRARRLRELDRASAAPRGAFGGR
ncbi:MAG: hypothetical protein HYY05_03845 [Chloroflexi bacterium]|nr:hypothetical protein [Chloroflexota bacterium]